jgi:hypothetical protein
MVTYRCHRRANPFIWWPESSLSKLKHESARFFNAALDATLDATLDAAFLNDGLVGQ